MFALLNKRRDMSESRTVQCELCPRGCEIADGDSGDCRIRFNRGGKLIASTYGRPCAVHVDPIEKKPFHHVLPGSSSFSIATAGCNLHCKNCQNWEISQAFAYEVGAEDMPPEKVAALAKQAGCESIAYTYSEPVVFYEYTYDTSVAAHELGLRNVIVTAGYLNPEPLRRLYKVLDAVKVDLKYFSDALYRSNSEATLKPVLDSILIAKEVGVWLEITNLVIPTISDDFDMIKRMCGWLAEKTGPDVPLHFSRFQPLYKLRELPVTPGETLDRAASIAKAAGLHYVYIGNRPGEAGESTFCPADGQLLIRRAGYVIVENNLKDGHCPKCGTAIPGVWK